MVCFFLICKIIAVVKLKIITILKIGVISYIYGMSNINKMKLKQLVVFVVS